MVTGLCLAAAETGPEINVTSGRAVEEGNQLGTSCACLYSEYRVISDQYAMRLSHGDD